MWYIEWIGIKSNISSVAKVKSVRFLYYDATVRNINSVFLKLRNTETDEVIETHGFPWSKFNSDLRMYHPYGWILGASGPDDAMLVAVDKESLEFLNLVKTITLADGTDTGVSKVIKRLTWHFTFWDESQTIVYCSSLMKQNAFTLLQVLCFLDKGWLDGKFILRWGAKWYAIEFTDAALAKSYITRMRKRRYNPMKEIVESLKSTGDLEE